MERAPLAKIVFRVVSTQCDDDFGIFAIYRGLGVARVYRRTRVVSRFAGPARVLPRPCSKNSPGVSGLDAIVFRLRYGATFRCFGVYLTDLVRARSGAAAAGAGVELATLGRGHTWLGDPVWHLCTILCNSSDHNDSA